MSVVAFRPAKPTVCIEPTDVADLDAGWSVVGIHRDGRREMIRDAMTPGEALLEIGRFEGYAALIIPDDYWRQLREG